MAIAVLQGGSAPLTVSQYGWPSCYEIISGTQQTYIIVEIRPNIPISPFRTLRLVMNNMGLSDRYQGSEVTFLKHIHRSILRNKNTVNV